MSLRVTRAGPGALVEDLGRPGLAALGVSRSGVADRAAAALALRCVGTHPASAVLEILLGGFAVEVDRLVVVVATGAPAPLTLTTADGRRRTAHTGEVLRLAAGTRLELGRPPTGLRTYLAVRGGIVVPEVLDSRSRDTLAALGPAPLAAGDVLGVGDAVVGPWADAWHAAPTGRVGSGRGRDEPVVLEVIPGPRDDHVTDEAWATLARVGHVSTHADRVGVRIEPASPLVRRVRSELPSEGVVRGAVQVPADGAPVVFGPDHPVTGGYPVIGVLTAASTDRITQLLPGTPVRMVRVPT